MTQAVICDRCGIIFEIGTKMAELEVYEIGRNMRTWKRKAHLCVNCAAWFDAEVKGVKRNDGRAVGDVGDGAGDD